MITSCNLTYVRPKLIIWLESAARRQLASAGVGAVNRLADRPSMTSLNIAFSHPSKSVMHIFPTHFGAAAQTLQLSLRCVTQYIQPEPFLMCVCVSLCMVLCTPWRHSRYICVCVSCTCEVVWCFSVFLLMYLCRSHSGKDCDRHHCCHRDCAQENRHRWR